MKDLPKDLAARVSRPVPVLDQVATLKAELEAAEIEEKAMFGNPSNIIRVKADRRGLPPLNELKPVPAKRPRDLPSRPVLVANPTIINPDADDSRFMPGRGRNPYILNHMNEWLVATAHQLAMRCSKQANGSILSDNQLLLLAESIRKSSLEKMSKGKQPAIVKVDSPSRPAYRLTTYGSSFVNYKFPTGKENDAQRLNKDFEITDALTLATIAAQLSVLSKKGYWGEGNSALEPALPVISRYRIAASHTRTFSSRKEAREAQMRSIEKWAQIPAEKGGIPNVGSGWDLGRMDDSMFSKVHNGLLNPIPGSRGGNGVDSEPDVWPPSLFESYGLDGSPDRIVDGVIGSPWIRESDSGSGTTYCNSGFSAIISEKWGQTDDRTKYVLVQTFETTIKYRNLYVFVTHNTIGIQIEQVWKSILGTRGADGKFPKGKYIDEKYADWLRIVYYEPLNSGKEEFAGEKAPSESTGEKKNHGAG